MLRVMVVDDEDDALNLMEILLRQIDGVEVAGCYTDAQQAIDALNERPVDAIFLDHQMPGMTGMAAARRIRQARPDLPIVFTTAYAAYAVEAFEVQSVDYLLKPIALHRLRDSVARVKRQASLFRDRLAKEKSPSILCMGGFRIQMPTAGDKRLTWKTAKEKEVCAYLIHHGGQFADTASIIEAVWPGYDLMKAKTYFYTCLSYLRKNLQEAGLPLSVRKAGEGFAIEAAEDAVDALALTRLLDRLLHENTAAVEVSYESATRLYGGDYMEGCDYGWAVPRQQELRTKYVLALRRMRERFRDNGDPLLEADCLRRILSVAPDSEADGRELILHYAESGNRNEALRVYRQLEQTVRVQLGVELEEETLRLYKRLRRDG